MTYNGNDAMGDDDDGDSATGNGATGYDDDDNGDWRPELNSGVRVR